MSDYAPEACHDHLMRSTRPILSFLPDRDYSEWRTAVAAKLTELLGDMPAAAPLDIEIESRERNDLFEETRFTFCSEVHARVVCHLLVPLEHKPPHPLMICLQGHSTGAHISLGRARFEGDERLLAGDRDFAIQAVREGYAALAIEQRCFGERRDMRPAETRHVNHGCHHASMTALLLGRTMIGERVWDVRRAIEALADSALAESALADSGLAHFPEIDMNRIGCMGNSGGGTITWFAACAEPRISAAMPSCYVCSLRQSIGSIDHCADNYLPGLLKWFDLGDLACLIAPRPLVVVAGRADDIFPIAGVEEAWERIQAVYRAAGAPDSCRLVVGDGGHRFYAQSSWPVFRELTEPHRK